MISPLKALDAIFFYIWQPCLFFMTLIALLIFFSCSSFWHFPAFRSCFMPCQSRVGQKGVTIFGSNDLHRVAVLLLLWCVGVGSNINCCCRQILFTHRASATTTTIIFLLTIMPSHKFAKLQQNSKDDERNYTTLHSWQCCW